MPRRLARKLILSITVIVLIVAAVSGLVNVTTEEKQLLNTVLLGAGQLSKGITSATWHAMLDDHREAAYQESLDLHKLNAKALVKVYRGADGWRRLDMRTPIYNERSCSQAECHAHPADIKTLGVLDLSLRTSTTRSRA